MLYGFNEQYLCYCRKDIAATGLVGKGSLTVGCLEYFKIYNGNARRHLVVGGWSSGKVCVCIICACKEGKCHTVHMGGCVPNNFETTIRYREKVRICTKAGNDSIGGSSEGKLHSTGCCLRSSEESSERRRRQSGRTLSVVGMAVKGN